MEVFELHLSEVALFTTTAQFPTSSLEEEAVNVGACRRELRVFILVLGVHNLRDQAHVIEWQTGGTGSNLHNGSQIRHGVEKSRNPHNRWSFKEFRPVN